MQQPWTSLWRSPPPLPAPVEASKRRFGGGGPGGSRAPPLLALCSEASARRVGGGGKGGRRAPMAKGTDSARPSAAVAGHSCHDSPTKTACWLLSTHQANEQTSGDNSAKKNCTYKQTPINSNQPHVGSHAHCTPPCHTLVSGEQLRSRSNDSVTCKQSSYSTYASIAAATGSTPIARHISWLPEFCKCCKMFCLQSSWR